MRTIVHISDLHFGRTDDEIIDPLLTVIEELKPDLVAVSGDLTQRAHSNQFKEARKFLDAIYAPRIVVPGNHDVPLYNLFSRFVDPLRKYHRYVSRDSEPFYHDTEIAVLGINTARSRTFKNGRISVEQIDLIRERFCGLDDTLIKILVTHHPFDVPQNQDEAALVGRAPLAMETLAECGADLLLAGHLHTTHVGNTATRYKIDGHSALVIQAGTATSTRARGEENSFNVLRIDRLNVTVERHTWHAKVGTFIIAGKEDFTQVANNWERSSAEPVYNKATV